jgi:hypothetical protein
MSLVRTSLFLAVALILLPIGCKDDDSPTSTGSTGVPPSLVGTWTLDSVTVNGVQADPGTLAALFGWPQEVERATITVEASGAYTLSGFNAASQVLHTVQGTIAVSGSNFTITSTSENGQPLNPPEVLAGTWAIVGNRLTLTISAQGLTIVITATK